MLNLRILCSCLGLIVLILSWYSRAESIRVETFTPNKVEHGSQIVLNGSITAIQDAEVSPQLAGSVAQLFVEVGDEVEQGQVLLQLDDTLAKLQLAQASAEKHVAQLALDEAKRLYKELEQLSQSQLAAQTQLAQRRTEVLTAQARLENAEVTFALQEELVARHQVKAPFAGLIHARHVDVGEWIGTGTSVLQILSHHALRLELAVPQQHYALLTSAPSLNVAIFSDLNRDVPIQSVVERIVSSVSAATRTFTVFVPVQQEAALLAGSSARAEISLPTSGKETFWVPKSAIKQHPDGGYSLFSVINGKAKRVLVDVVHHKADNVAVTGTNSNQVFVKSGVELLKDGDLLSTASNKEHSQ